MSQRLVGGIAPSASPIGEGEHEASEDLQADLTEQAIPSAVPLGAPLEHLCDVEDAGALIAAERCGVSPPIGDKGGFVPVGRATTPGWGILAGEDLAESANARGTAVMGPMVAGAGIDLCLLARATGLAPVFKRAST